MYNFKKSYLDFDRKSKEIHTNDSNCYHTKYQLSPFPIFFNQSSNLLSLLACLLPSTPPSTRHPRNTLCHSCFFFSLLFLLLLHVFSPFLSAQVSYPISFHSLPLLLLLLSSRISHLILFHNLFVSSPLHFIGQVIQPHAFTIYSCSPYSVIGHLIFLCFFIFIFYSSFFFLIPSSAFAISVGQCFSLLSSFTCPPV